MYNFFKGVSIENVVNSGPGLVFITYPEVVLKLPGGPIWAVTFFVMLVVSNKAKSVVHRFLDYKGDIHQHENSTISFFKSHFPKEKVC